MQCLTAPTNFGQWTQTLGHTEVFNVPSCSADYSNERIMLQLATPDIKIIQRTHRQIKVLPSGSGSSHSHSGEAQTSPSVSAAPPPPPPTDHVL